VAAEYDWQLEAWAIFSNHYHFVAHSPASGAVTLPTMLRKLHSKTAIWINKLDLKPGRKIWHNYRETILDIEASYLARLNYVHQNPVHHGLVPVANQYPWCSAAWFEGTATPAQIRMIYGMKLERVRVTDEFEVVAPS
jgi:putative transposase